MSNDQDNKTKLDGSQPYNVVFPMKRRVQMGERIRALRESLGETQSVFAERFNTNKSSVSSWENGVYMPSTTRMIEMARLSDVTLDEFIGNVEE